MLAPIGLGRYLGEHIPGAKLIELEGSDSALPLGDSETPLMALEEFLTGRRHSQDPARIMAAVS